MNRSKRVLLFLVEGVTEQAALGSILRSIFSSNEVNVVLTRGDICMRDDTTAGNALEKVGRAVKSARDRYKYQKSDMLSIIHIIDTDGAFIPPERITASETGTTVYGTDGIAAASVTALRDRYQRKTQIVRRLCGVSEIGGTPYRLFYFSRNLEHVLHNRAETLETKEKVRLAGKFEDRFLETPRAFIPFIRDEAFAVLGNYDESWQYILEGTNSLLRKSNLGILFEGME